MTTAKERAMPLAAKVAFETMMVPTGANLETIQRAIEREAELMKIRKKEVVEMLILAAKEEPGPVPVNRFWFEDSRWRSKEAYKEFRKRHLRKQRGEDVC